VKPVAGLVLGSRYRLVRLIAVGGMGEVWVAHDLALARDVAAKVLKEEYAGNEDFLERLRTEARNAAGLSHTNIAQLFDYGEQGGSGYLILELIVGEPMSDLLEREPILPLRRLLPILSQTARGLHAAHVGGVVHRDVKPGNILLEHGSTVKITDFGVSLGANQVPMTAAGMVMGTAQYLSPEQAIGKPATGASDIYALGIVAYEAIVGHRPFTGATAVDIAVAHVNEAVPPLPATVHVELAKLVMQMLEKDPVKRPRSAATLARLLDEIAESIADDPYGHLSASRSRHGQLGDAGAVTGRPDRSPLAATVHTTYSSRTALSAEEAAPAPLSRAARRARPDMPPSFPPQQRPMTRRELLGHGATGASVPSARSASAAAPSAPSAPAPSASSAQAPSGQSPHAASAPSAAPAAASPAAADAPSHAQPTPTPPRAAPLPGRTRAATPPPPPSVTPSAVASPAVPSVRSSPGVPSARSAPDGAPTRSAAPLRAAQAWQRTAAPAYSARAVAPPVPPPPSLTPPSLPPSSAQRPSTPVPPPPDEVSPREVRRFSTSTGLRPGNLSWPLLGLIAVGVIIVVTLIVNALGGGDARASASTESPGVVLVSAAALEDDKIALVEPSSDDEPHIPTTPKDE